MAFPSPQLAWSHVSKAPWLMAGFKFSKNMVHALSWPCGHKGNEGPAHPHWLSGGRGQSTSVRNYFYNKKMGIFIMSSFLNTVSV